ncbi:DEKNAAC105488 [Brettanomyces naardenensis]|uniref:DEKNAAC105488 n=1 Tax=Brettanomyces naardenensis TaxID=13370 RepID=A0A448YTV2_BRENA|nr:DEKNAAC105488 [Brettanomyces naardenensis]
MTSEELDPETASIIVVGCGVFGLSTILELTKKGYKNVIGLDVNPVPSPRSAATDYNKMLRTEYANLMYARLSVEALESWEKDPLYQPFYKKCGRLVLSPYTEANKARIIYDKIGAENVKKLGVNQRIIELRSSEEIAKLIPAFKHNNLPNPLIARYNIDSALGVSGESLVAVYRESARRGAKFVFGEGGHVVKVEEGKVTAKNGHVYHADKIIVTSGANTPALVNLEDIVTAIGHFVSHVQLTNEEYEKYKDMPIFFSSEFGYFFPPDPKDHVIKIGHAFADARNSVKNPFNRDQITSIPEYVHDAPTIVKDATKRLMNLAMPDLANNPVVNCTIAWTSLSYDESFVIDYAPRSKSIVLCTGDSAHGYKFLPNIGKYIVQRLDGTLDQEHAIAWRYRHPVWGTRAVSERTQRDVYDVKNLRRWIKGTKLSPKI